MARTVLTDKELYENRNYDDVIKNIKQASCIYTDLE